MDIPRNLIAIDPASSQTGIAVFHKGELVKTYTLTADNSRRQIANKIASLFETFTDADVACEEPFFQGKANTSMQRLLGMIEHLCHKEDRPLHFYHPSTVKAFFGAMKKSKLEMALDAGEFLNDNGKEILADAITEENYDVTDAICIGIQHLERIKANDASTR